MAFSKSNTMAQPIPEPINWNVLLNTLVYVIGGLIGWVYFVSWYFKNKSKEKEAWIKQIATTAVNAAMDNALKDVRDDIKILFRHREDDRKHIDTRLDIIMTRLE